jgi:hypothetical protein
VSGQVVQYLRVAVEHAPASDGRRLMASSVQLDPGGAPIHVPVADRLPDGRILPDRWHTIGTMTDLVRLRGRQYDVVIARCEIADQPVGPEQFVSLGSADVREQDGGGIYLYRIRYGLVMARAEDPWRHLP